MVLKSSSALSALRCLLHLLLISGSFLLCIYQENPVPMFLQTANENHHLSWRMRPVGGWLFSTPACTPAIWTSDPRKSHRREVFVFLALNVLRDTLVPFPGSKYRCRRISLGSHVLCSAHIVQISCFLSGVLQTSFSGPNLPVHRHAAAGDTPQSDSEGSGMLLSAQRHCVSCKIWKAEGIASRPSPSFCTTGSGASGCHLFL